jgi:NAD(P)-dependent dehydrogenase (short-subunit alcohol dehydrogenase family)
MMAVMSEPYVSPYVVSKHGIMGFSRSLRQELWLDGLHDVAVCVIMPATIDTPFFQHSANYTGRAPKAMPPVYTAERVARTIVDCARVPRRQVYVGNAARLIGQQSKTMPAMTERMVALMTDRQHLYQDRPAPVTTGNLYEPLPEGTSIDGGWHGRRKTAVRRLATAALLTAALAKARAGSRRT